MLMALPVKPRPREISDACGSRLGGRDDAELVFQADFAVPPFANVAEALDAIDIGKPADACADDLMVDR